MKRKFFTIIAICFATLLFAQNNQEPVRVNQLFNFGWKFQLGDKPEAINPNFNDANFLTIQPYIAMQHNAFKIYQDPLALPGWICFESFSIPSHAQCFKAAAPVSSAIPFIFNLKIMGQV